MGKFKFILFVAAACLIASCAKDEGFGPGPDFRSGMGHGQHFSCPAIMVPAPTGTDDTQNILNAINLAKEEGPGTLVQLQAGTYLTGFMEIGEFFGTIRGAGKGKTIIKPLSDLPCEAELVKSAAVSLITFIGGEVTIEDLSFRVDDGQVCSTDVGYGGDLYILLKFTDRLHNAYIPEKIYCKGEIRNVEFTGGHDDAGTSPLYNVLCAIWQGFDFGVPAGEERANVDLKVTMCSFTDYMVGIDVAGLGKGSMIYNNNSFSNSDCALFIFDNINVTGIFENNCFSSHNWYDVVIDDTDYGLYGFYTYHPPEKVSTYKISNNEFRTIKKNGSYIYPYGTSMYLMDQRRSLHPDENMGMKFIVTNNRIHLSDGANGIVGLSNMDAMIIANKFSGIGTTGISLNGASPEIMAADNKVLGNIFMEAGLETDVLLGEFTTNCLVTRNRRDVVVDLGVNNKIAGMPK